MKEILDNWIFITHKKDINLKLVKPFWERLSMFLALNVGNCPKVKCTSDRDTWTSWGGTQGRSFYNEDNSTVVFYLPFYQFNTGQTIKKNISTELMNYAVENNYKYVIPVTDIYHEFIHHVQFVLGDWLYDDLLEASAEHTTYLITGQDMGDYIEEKIALWYIGRKMLRLKSWQFYIFIRDCIVDSQFYKEYFFDDPMFVKILANEFGGSVEKLFMTMKQRLGKKKWRTMMNRDLKKIHTQIFYRW